MNWGLCKVAKKGMCYFIKVRGTRVPFQTSKSLVPAFPSEFGSDSHLQGHCGFLMIEEMRSLVKRRGKKQKVQVQQERLLGKRRYARQARVLKKLHRRVLLGRVVPGH